jgi:hypothetical protein
VQVELPDRDRHGVEQRKQRRIDQRRLIGQGQAQVERLNDAHLRHFYVMGDIPSLLQIHSIIFVKQLAVAQP